MRTGAITLSIASLALFTGCGPNMDFSLGDDFMADDDTSHFGFSIPGPWSEDDSALAYVGYTFDVAGGKPFSLGGSISNNTYALYVVDRQLKTSKRLNAPPFSMEALHYMRKAGYVLVRMDLGGDFSSGPYTFLMVDTKDGGSYARVGAVESGYDHDVIPSPDGFRLAETQFISGCRLIQGVSTSKCRIEIRMRNAIMRAYESPTDTVEFVIGNAGAGYANVKPPVPVWSPLGDFYLTTDYEAWRKTPGFAAVHRAPPACRSPRTSSGPVSSQREAIRYGYRDADSTYGFIFEPAHDTVTTFGCLPKEG